MLRVPGTQGDLFSVKAGGGDVRIVYSPMDALKIAQSNPDREVVFFAVGFETTAPPNAMAAFQARRLGVANFSLLVSHVLVPPAMDALLGAPDNQVQGFLAAGHVCTVMGIEEYHPIAARYRVPIVATGFEPLDILHGVRLCLEQLEAGRAEATIQYGRSVRPEGNPAARKMVADVFQTVDRKWRGIGMIPQSGWALRPEYDPWNAEKKFGVEGYTAEEPAECQSGAVLRGVAKPCECPAFGRQCTPEHPLGAPMVSSEGACAAYYRYRR
jgi:hydrogenase expression/formation protein HypD